MSIAIEKKIVDRPAPIVLHVPIEEEIVLADDVKVPAGIVDLTTFREWNYSPDFPERGRIEYSNGTIYLDLSMEQLFDHIDVKDAICETLRPLSRKLKLGRFLGDGARVSMPPVDASRIPDTLFVSFESLRSNRVRLIDGRRHGKTEIEGPPDMVSEILSDSSEEKDLIELPEQYFRAGVREYWRIDARKDTCAFEIFRAGSDGFIRTEQKDGWQWSDVFGHWFCIVRTMDEVGNPLFELLAKEQV